MLDIEAIEKDQNIIESNKEQDKETLIQEENINEKNSESDNKLEEVSNGNNGRWNKEEHSRFLAGCLLYKNNWKKVETYVRTRTSTQIRSHAQKFLKKLEKKYFVTGLDMKPQSENINEELINDDLIKEEKNDEIKNENNTENKEKESDVNINKNELNEIKDLKNINKISMHIKEEKENKLNLSEEKIKELVDELNQENTNTKIIEKVEKIIINIFRPNKKCEDLSKSEPKKQSSKINNTHVKANKNIFLCQKQKREINYESIIKEKLNSNSQTDLDYILKIYKRRILPEYNFLLAFLNDNN